MTATPREAQLWNDRYSGTDLVWSSAPNRWVVEVCASLPPGQALDIAAGEGRHAIWLADRGWHVTATDFASAAVARLRQQARQRLGSEAAARIQAAVADATAPAPGGPYDLTLLCYLQLPLDRWQIVLQRAVEATKVGGRILVVLHARENLMCGFGGPQDADLLHDPASVRRSVVGLPVRVERAELVSRAVDTDEGPRQALDSLVVLRRT